jgi:hypothetical protein
MLNRAEEFREQVLVRVKPVPPAAQFLFQHLVLRFGLLEQPEELCKSLFFFLVLNGDFLKLGFKTSELLKPAQLIDLFF